MDAWMDGLDGMGISLVQVAETFGVEPASPSGGNNAYMFRQSKGFHLHCLRALQGGLWSFIIFVYDALFL